MKNLFKALLGVAFFGAILVSCSKDDDAAPTAPLGKLIGKVDGVKFEADAATAMANGQLTITATTSGNTISLSIFKTLATGTYDVKGVTTTASSDARVTFASSGSSKTYSSSNAENGQTVGSITITELDEANNTVSGTFNSKTFYNGAVVNITEGSFSKIPYTPTNPSTGTSGSMSAKVDGQNFTPSLVTGVNALGVLTVTGATASGSQMIGLVFSTSPKTGTYDLSTTGMDVYASYTTTADTFISESGTIVVTIHNTSTRRIEGTFNFTGETLIGSATHTITNGKFAVTY